MQPQRAVLRLVVDELPLPGEQSLVFQTLDRLARTKTHIAGKNIHQFVLRASCWIGGVLADFRVEPTRLPKRRQVMRFMQLASQCIRKPVYPTSRRTASTTLRWSAVSAACGGTGSPTS